MRLPIASLVLRLLGLWMALNTSLFALPANSDQVVLFNGDRITGRVLESSAESVRLLTEAAGTINIARTSIKEVISQPAEAVRPAQVPQPPAMSQPPELLPPSELVQTGTREPQPSPHCMHNAKPVPSSWAFMLQGAPDRVVLGTQSQVQFGAGADLRFCESSPREITEIAARGSHVRNYKQRSSSIQTDVASAHIEQQHFFRSPQGPAVFAVGELFTNNSLGMAMQKSVGLGLLTPQYHHRSFYYDFAVEARYLNQHLDHSGPPLNLAAVRVKEQTHSQGSIFTWNQQAWVMPAINNVHALQAYASLGPAISLKPWLRLGFTEEESYLGNAPRPNRKNYFSSVLSLTIQGSGSIRDSAR